MMVDVRSIATSVAGFILLAMVGGLISANVRQAAAKRGWDAILDLALAHVEQAPIVGWLVGKIKSVLAGWSDLHNRWWLWLALGLSTGIALSLWIVPQIGPTSVPPTSSSTSPIYVENIEVRSGGIADPSVTVLGMAANAIGADLNIGVDYRLQATGNGPTTTPRHSIMSIGKIEPTRKGAPIQIQLLKSTKDGWYSWGDLHDPNDRFYEPEMGMQLLYARIDIGPANQEQHVYFQIVWVDQKRQPFAIFFPAISSDWASAWEKLQ